MAEDQKTRERNEPIVDAHERRRKPDACIESQAYGHKAKQWKQNGRDDHTSDSVHGRKQTLDMSNILCGGEGESLEKGKTAGPNNAVAPPIICTEVPSIHPSPEFHQGLQDFLFWMTSGPLWLSA